MAINELSIPFPDFKLNDVIDPEEFDSNNAEIVNKINLIIDVINQITDSVESGGSGADIISLTSISPFTSTKLQGFLQDIINRLQSTSSASSGASFIGTPPIAGVTGNTVSAQLASLKSLLDGVNTALSDVYTKAEVDAKVRGTDTNIIIENFVVTVSDRGDGKFEYKNEDNVTIVGDLTPEGYQTFTLEKGSYIVGMNRIEAYIGDTLHRSTVSGGLREDAPNKVTLTSPVSANTEVTFKYFETVAMSGSQALPFTQPTAPSIANKLVGMLWIDTSN